MFSYLHLLQLAVAVNRQTVDVFTSAHVPHVDAKVVDELVAGFTGQAVVSLHEGEAGGGSTRYHLHRVLIYLKIYINHNKKIPQNG